MTKNVLLNLKKHTKDLEGRGQKKQKVAGQNKWAKEMGEENSTTTYS